MNVPFFNLRRQYDNIKTEIDTAFSDVLERTDFVNGKAITDFEKSFAEYNNVKHCSCVTNGTIALHLSLLALGVSPGDEVILPVNTFIATAEAVSHCGATPVFADVNEDDYCMDTESFKKAITNKTKAVIPVHLYGHPVDIEELLNISLGHGIDVVEDCAQAHGATVNGKKVGSFGKLGAFSFYPSKNLGAYGEGGAILTDDEELLLLIKNLKDHGSIQKHKHELVGYNYRMSGLQGASLSVKLKYLDEWNYRRIEIAHRYCKNLSDLPIKLQICQEGRKHVYHLLVAQVNDRNGVIDKLKQKGIGAGIHYMSPLHLTEAYNRIGYKKGDFPVAEEISDRIISLPMFPELRNDEIDYVCYTLRDILNEK